MRSKISIASMMLPLFLMFIAFIGQAQVLGQKIKWNSNSAVEIGSSQPRTISSFFISDGNKLTWDQPGKVTYEFTITQTQGTWQDVNTDGSLQLTVSIGQKSSTAVLARNEGNLSVTLSFPSDQGSAKTYKFNITGIEILQ